MLGFIGSILGNILVAAVAGVIIYGSFYIFHTTIRIILHLVGFKLLTKNELIYFHLKKNIPFIDREDKSLQLQDEIDKNNEIIRQHLLEMSYYKSFK